MEGVQNHKQISSVLDQRRLIMHSKSKKSLQQKEKKEKEEEKVKLAAIAIGLNIRLKSADMSFTMQERALGYTRYLLGSESANTTNTILALSLKKEFDSLYGPAWHCVVGKSFGSFVTHSPGGFVYFSIDSLSFLLFKTEVHLIKETSRY